MPGQTYKGIDAPVPWMKIITSQASDLDQVVGRPGVLNLQHLTDSKIGQSPHQSITSAAANSNTRVPEITSILGTWEWTWMSSVHTSLIIFSTLLSFVYF
jgi:hypothetical protein